MKLNGQAIKVLEEKVSTLQGQGQKQLNILQDIQNKVTKNDDDNSNKSRPASARKLSGAKSPRAL